MDREMEQQPFIKSYSDDPTANEHHGQYQPQRRRTQLISHCSVFLATSLLWILVMLFMVDTHSGSTCQSPNPNDGPGEQDGHDMYNAHSTHGTHQTHPGHYDANNRHNVTSGARLVMCGNSTAEARALGCRYDILLNNWVPAQCADQESVEEYREDESWAAFADKNMTRKLTVEEMSERDFYYTSIRDHVNHCAIIWRRQFWALFDDRRAIDTVVASPGHTEHCSQYLIDVLESKWTEPTRTEMGFAGCWIRD